MVESDRSGGDDPDEATSDVSIAVLDVNDTRPSGLRRGRRVLRGAPSDRRAAAGAGDALSQRARRRDRVQLGAECVRAQPAAAVEARAPAAARHATLGRSAHHGLLLRAPSSSMHDGALESDGSGGDEPTSFGTAASACEHARNRQAARTALVEARASEAADIECFNSAISAVARGQGWKLRSRCLERRKWPGRSRCSRRSRIRAVTRHACGAFSG